MQNEPTHKRKFQSGNVILVGMMGAGKTTVGKLLSQKLGCTFVDSDEEIQQRTGVTIPHIFDIEGEAGFRQRETSVILDLVKRDNLILATGGGAVLGEQNRDAISANGMVVYLKSTVHDLWLRTRNDRNRPLLQTVDPRAKLKELYELRDPLYTQIADVVMPTGKQSVHSLVAQLLEELERRRGVLVPCNTKTNPPQSPLVRGEAFSSSPDKGGVGGV